MALVTKHMEMRGMPRLELVEYFLEIGRRTMDENTIQASYFKVTISEQKTCKLGSLILPTTDVTIEAEDNYIEQVVADFRKRFLSAGG